jgi:F0F1-type ATP synthase assembly protein I
MADERPPLVEAMRYTQIGFMLVAPTVLGGAIGYWLDRRFGTRPWLLLGGLLFGMAAGFVSFIRMVLPPRGGGDGGAGT